MNLEGKERGCDLFEIMWRGKEGRIMQGLVGEGKEFGFYSKIKKLLKGFKEGNAII